MKRFLVVTAAMLLTVGAVYGYSTNVPFYLDNADSGGVGTGGTQAAYVGLHNNSSEDVVITVAYFSADGVALGPATGNTAVITANASVSFRPGGDFQGASESAAAAAIPDRPTPDGKLNGSIVISWTDGVEGTIQGREHQQTDSFAAAYLLPPGQ